MDPVSKLPHEILTMVFSQLPFREVMKCQRVSRNWWTFLCSEKSLYRSIDLVSRLKPLKLRSIKRLITLSGGEVRSLSIHELENTFTYPIHRDSAGFKPQASALFLPLFKSLARLDLLKSPNWDHNPLDLSMVHLLSSAPLIYLNIEIPAFLSTVIQYCQAAPQLEYLGCCICRADLANHEIADWKFPVLKTLSLQAYVDNTNWADSIVQLFPNLVEVNIQRNGSTKQQTTPSVWSFPLKTLRIARFRSLPMVSKFNFTSTELSIIEIQTNVNVRDLELPIQSHLEELTISNVSRLDSGILHRLCASAPSLKRLTISSPQFTVNDIEPFLCEGLNLRFLELNSTSDVRDKTLFHLQPLKYLDHLHLNHCPDITGNGIIRLIQSLSSKNGGKLRYISLVGNETIRRQTIDWARDQGVIISI